MTPTEQSPPEIQITHPQTELLEEIAQVLVWQLEELRAIRTLLAAKKRGKN